MSTRLPSIICIPQKLVSKDNPDLANFPLNVLFASVNVKNGQMIAGTALYEPVLETFSKTANKFYMEYKSTHDSNNWLIIEYDAEEKSFFGKKFVNSQDVGTAVGKEWKAFFHHFTSLGVSDGEFCEMQNI